MFFIDRYFPPECKKYGGSGRAVYQDGDLDVTDWYAANGYKGRLSISLRVGQAVDIRVTFQDGTAPHKRLTFWLDRHKKLQEGIKTGKVKKDIQAREEAIREAIVFLAWRGVQIRSLPQLLTSMYEEGHRVGTEEAQAAVRKSLGLL